MKLPIEFGVNSRPRVSVNRNSPSPGGMAARAMSLRGTTRGSVRCLGVEVVDRNGPGLRLEVDVPALGQTRGLAARRRGENEVTRRAIGSGRRSSSARSSGARRQSRAGIGLCERCERGDQPRARSLARSVGGRMMTPWGSIAARRTQTRLWPRCRRASPSRAAGDGELRHLRGGDCGQGAIAKRDKVDIEGAFADRDGYGMAQFRGARQPLLGGLGASQADRAKTPLEWIPSRRWPR